jgi:hypothetical protein
MSFSGIAFDTGEETGGGAVGAINTEEEADRILLILGG